jgi:hypothetical protein
VPSQRRLARHHPHHRLAGLGDDELLSFGRLLDQTRPQCPGPVDVDGDGNDAALLNHLERARFDVAEPLPSPKRTPTATLARFLGRTRRPPPPLVAMGPAAAVASTGRFGRAR